ncbi:SusC/RagA family TonB-linked outer membrane protein [uncultured Bacteroides sp.]|uniref:SusC/RagA family TonB-linked outer membrane protein n=1 Tax=uncultured Bacteroides sp. TaxID=162156 RepID=UPI002AAA9BF1|nr:SusC/RagA family TonB-linked outer membrane protein [uncultured Bacteroides sp.]
MKKKCFVLCSMLLILFSATYEVSAQNVGKASGITIRGIVSDMQGEPLVGATVKLMGLNTSGTITDVDGKYSISVSSESSVLEFSFIGFVKRKIEVGKNRTLNVVLKTDNQLLDEVVVTGYQTISKERATGAFSKVSGKVLQEQRLNSLSTLLEGRVAGYANGLVRGTTTMNGVTNPLYVIDGFPVESTRYTPQGNLVENIPDLNMEDIESITVLKDAAATSIYGARAANGVVVIVTKKVAKGKTEVSFSSTLTFSPYSFYKDRLTNSADIIDLEKEWADKNPNLQGNNAETYAANLLKYRVYTNQGITAILNSYAGNITQEEMNSTLNALSGKGYNYYDDVKKYAKTNPFYQQYNLSIGNATEKNNFKVSLTYKNNQYENKYSDRSSFGLNITNSTEITNWLRLDVGSYTKYTNATTQTYDPLSPGYTYMPYDGLVDAEGNPYTSTAESRYSQDIVNRINTYGLYSMDITPLDEIGRNLGKEKNFLNRSFVKFNVKLTDWLKYETMFQYEYGVDRYNKLSDKESYSVRAKVNGLATATTDGKVTYNLPYGDINYDRRQYSSAYDFRQQLNLNKSFGDKHDLIMILGSEIRSTKLEYKDETQYGYDPEMLTYTPIDAASLLKTYNGLMGGYFYSSDLSYRKEKVDRFVSFYGNAAYTYDSKYTASGSLRWDRSNLWGTNSKYQNKPIWSVGTSWNINKESFFHVSWVDMLKLRLSYGIGGNVAKDAAPYLTAYYSANSNVGGTQGTVGTRPNPELSWEKTRTVNVGFDFSLLRNRLNGSVEYYDKKGSDLLANANGVPTEGFGYSTYKINNGEMTNRGVELTLSGDVIRTKDFLWNVNLMYSYNKNKVTYVNVEAPVYYLQLDYPSAYPRIGNPYNSIYGYKWAGLNEKGLPQVYDENGEKTTTQPASLDAIHDLGSTVPSHTGSLGSSLQYKNWQMSFMLIYQLGHKIRNTDLPYLQSNYNRSLGQYMTSIGVVNKDIKNRWKAAGDEAHTDVPAVIFAESPDYYYGSYSVYSYADINVLDASNIRLSNISLSYRLPQTICQKLFLKNARLQFNVENLYTFAFEKKAKYLLGGYNSPNYVWGLYLNF